MHLFQCIEMSAKFRLYLFFFWGKGPFCLMKGKNISRMKNDFIFKYTFLNMLDFLFSLIDFYWKHKTASAFLIIPTFPFLGSITESLLPCRIQTRQIVTNVPPLNVGLMPSPVVANTGSGVARSRMPCPESRSPPAVS